MPSSEAWTVAGDFISVVALFLSIVFFAAGRKKRLLTYEISSTPLITESMTAIPKLSVSFDGQPVNNLISTTVKFTNSGNQMLESSDFAARQPLRLSVSGCFFDGQSEIAATADNPNSIPSIETIDAHTKRIVFDFLEPKRSFKLTLLHDGGLSVLGNLKGGRIIFYTSAPSRLDLLALIGYFIFSIASFAFLVLLLIVDGLHSLFALLCFFVFFITVFFYLLYDYLKTRSR